MRELAHDQAQELRLVGVHEDGAHLILSAASGDVFRLPLDEALRRAVSRPAPQRPAPAGADGSGVTPRQIQTEIRAGATAEEVAASSGVPLARVQRFEGPVLAEREHMARRAQAVEVPGKLPTHETLRGPAADLPATLGEMAAYRLSLYGVSADSVEWDSWRRPDGQWTVVARFNLPDGAPSSIGEDPPAMWTYHPIHRTIANANRWAQQLSELEPLDGPAPRRRLAAVSDRPFDVEASDGRPRTEGPLDREADLLDMLRARRGQRLGVDEEGDDALALLLTHGIPAAHPRPSDALPDSGGSADAQEWRGSPEAAPPEAGRPERADFPDRSGDEDEDDGAGLAPVQRGGITSLLSRLNARAQEDAGDGPLGLHPGMSTATREITVVPPTRPTGGEDSDRGPRPGGSREAHAKEPPGPESETPRIPPPTPESTRPERPSTEPPRRPSRPKRSSVPSWDEIVFGTKGD